MGSFTMAEEGRRRTGGLSVSLAGPDGRVVGGVVAGMLRAASPIQVHKNPIETCTNYLCSHNELVRTENAELLLVHSPPQSDNLNFVIN